MSPGGGCVSPFEFASAANALNNGLWHEFLILEKDNHKSYRPPKNVPYYFMGNVEDFFKRANQYDVLHINWWQREPVMTNLFKAAKESIRIPKIITCDVYPAGPEFRLSKDEIDFADLIVFDGKSAFDVYADLDMTKKLFIVGGTNLEQYTQAKRTRRDKKFRIGRGATLTHWKMPENIVGLVEPILEAIPESEFHLFGHGPLETKIRMDVAQSKYKNQIFLRGWVSNFPEEVANLDAYLYHLPNESFASSELNLQGVMAAGIPIVARPSHGTQWMFEDRKDSLIAETYEVCVPLMIGLHNSPELRHEIAQNSSQKAKSHFGVQVMLKAYNELVYSKWQGNASLKRSNAILRFIRLSVWRLRLILSNRLVDF